MYDKLVHFAHTWGLIYMVVLFLATVVYALWPSSSSRKKFDDAARIPLEED